MKKVTVLLGLILLFTSGCGTAGLDDAEPNEDLASFSGTVIQLMEEGALIVEPHEGEDIRRSGTEVAVSPEDDQIFEVGDQVRVTHEGPIMESHPLQVHLISIDLIDD